MDAASDFTSGEKTRNGVAGLTDDAGRGINLETTHGVVQHWSHDGDVEEVVHLHREVVEELLAEWIFLGLGNLVVGVDWTVLSAKECEIDNRRTHKSS